MKFASIVGRVAAALGLVLAVGVMPIGAQTPVTLQVTAPPIDGAGPVFYAQDLGYFRDAGITVEFAGGLNNAAAALAALSGGSLDISAAAVTSIAAAHLAGIDMKLIAPAQLSTDQSPTEVIAVRKDSTAQNAADLNGKTIGIIGVKSMMQPAAMSWLDRHGGDAKTLKFIEVPLPQMCPQLTAGRIDAAVMAEPFTSGCTDARVIGNADDGIAPRFISLGFVATGDWLKAHADVAARFAAAIARAAAWGNTHPRESAVILVKYARLEPAVANSMGRASYATQLTPALIQPVIDASAKYGVIPHAFPAAEIIWAR